MQTSDTYTDRVSQVIDAIGIDTVVAVFNTSPSQVYRIRKDASTLSFTRLYDLAKKAGINIDWLATGAGEPESGNLYTAQIPFLFEPDATPFYLDSYFASDSAADLHAALVVDDAMGEVYKTGSVVVVDKAIKTGNGTFSLMVAGVFTLRNIKAQVDGSIKISALNANYDDMTLPKESLNLVDIVGRVVWSGQNHG